jgi:hypothetical protein
MGKITRFCRYFQFHWGVIWFPSITPVAEGPQGIDRAAHTLLAPIQDIDVGLGGSDNLVADVFQRVAAAMRA